MTKMSNARFRTIIVTIMVIVLALTAIITQTALDYAASLDWALGRGERQIKSLGELDESQTQYYDSDYETAQDSQLAASELVKEIVEEGAVLLKNENDALPISRGDVVTPLGYHYLSPFYGGSGSAAMDMTADYVVNAEEALNEFFTVNNEIVGKMKGAQPEVLIYADDNDDTNIAEFNVDVYKGAENSCKDTTGIVFIARPGMEGYDANSVAAYEDGTATQMELSKNERDMIAYAKENCEKVVVIINSPSQVEVASLQTDEGIDAILWVGTPGATGFYAMSEILAGEINPSGRTPDIWYSDFKADPTFVNRISTAYTNPIEDGPDGYMEYAEGIYMGYRYYETRFVEDNSFDVFGKKGTYEDAVVYPFGYGLHYENDKISQELSNVTEKDGIITVKGTVTNESSRDVKEVVQIYFGAPYTPGGIEKSAKELIKFTKVDVPAGGKTSFELEFPLEDMASYDYRKLYTNTGSYVLEAGNYEIYLGKDSHDSWGQARVEVAETKVYADEAIQGVAVGKRTADETIAVNLLSDMNEYVESGEMTVMSRSDFAGTFPKMPEEKAMSEKVLADVQDFDYLSDPRLGEVEGSILYQTEEPVSNANNGLSLSALRGLDYDDPSWEALLDNLDYSSEDFSELFTHGLYQTAAVEAIGLVLTKDHDGTTGITATWGGNNELASQFGLTSNPVEAACAYPCGGLQAATWNLELLEKMGEAIGAEALTNGINGWYAPGLNLHRTPYGGRNFEYYSEDPVLTGYTASAVVSGAFTKGGLIAYIKHFALNETDDNRSGVAVWADEQTCRQLYFKAFEICIKNANGTERYYDTESGELKTIQVKACRALMSSMNYIGAKSPTNSYTLLTDLLRGEWGFVGMVLTDFTSGTYKRPDIGYRLGNDLWMGMMATPLDLTSATSKHLARKAMHNIAYVIVNSNAYNGIEPGSYAQYSMSPWKKGLIAFDIAVVLLSLLAVGWIVLRQRDEKKNPGKYKAK